MAVTTPRPAAGWNPASRATGGSTPGDAGTVHTTTAYVRLAIVTAMGVVIALVAGGIFDRVRAVLVLAPLAAGIAAAATRNLRTLWQAAALAATTLVVAIVTAVVEGGSVADGLWSFVRGPRRLLSTEWPSPVDPTIVATVGAFLAVATGVAGWLATSRRWRLAPTIPLAVAAVAVLAMAAPHRPPWWAGALLGAGVLALGLLPVDQPLRQRTTSLLGDRTLGVTISAAALVALAASAVVASDDRADPRQVEDADQTSTVLDPLEATVALRRAEPPIPLFDITDRSPVVGRALPARWRLAALDVYDGQRWVPEVTLRPIGSRLGEAPLVQPGDLPPITYEVLFLTDDLDLVPFPGRPLEIDAPVETDLARVAVRLVERPDPGTSVTARSMIAPTIATVVSDDVGDSNAEPELDARVATRPIDEIAQTFTEQARELAGSGEPIEQLRAIEATMRTEWILDREAAGGGQQLALLERFVDDTRRGTREQFVSAFVLLARALGIDARVATGFVVPPDDLTSPLVIQSTHSAAWPEVRLRDDDPGDGRDPGWVAFDPVPAASQDVEDEQPEPPESQSPAAAQPPIEPPAEDTDDDEERTVEVDDEQGRWAAVVEWGVRAVAVTTIALLPLLAVVGTILLLKWRRRRQRRRLTDPSQRVRGAWADVTDSLVDAGLTVAPAWTDDRIAVAGSRLAPGAPHELRRLAAMATAVTFGPTVDAWRLVDDATATRRTVDAALRADLTRWQRIRWRLSLRSLRRGTRSPVVV